MKHVLAMAVGLSVVVTGGAHAQEAGDAPSAVVEASPAQVSEETEALLTRLAVDQLMRLSLETVRQSVDPAPELYSTIATALELLQRYRPEDEELMRLRMMALRSAGDREELLDASKELLRLEPGDTVAQLRVLTAGIRSRQRAADRMALYDRLLGPKGQALDVSIRSRLAFDAALLAREMGEEGTYRDRLLVAAEDRTNKEAAALFATEFLDRAKNGLERVEILANLIMSDPMDPGAMETLARELMRHGAFRGAQRFWERTSDVQVHSGRGMSAQQLFEYYLTLWALDGPEACLEPLNDAYYAEVLAMQQRHAQMEEDGLEVPEGEEVLLPVLAESLRLGVFIALGRTEVEEEPEDEADAAPAYRPGGAREDEEEEEPREPTELELLVAGLSPAHNSLRRIEKRLTQIYESQEEAVREIEADEDKTEQEREDARRSLEEYRASILLDMTSIRLWSGLTLDEAEQNIGAIGHFVEQEIIEEGAAERFRGVLAAQRGDAETARAILEPILAADPDDRLARYGLAIASMRNDETDRAAGEFETLALRAPDTLLGALAREYYKELTGEVFVFPDETRRIDRYAVDFAPWLDNLTLSPRNFIDLSLNAVQSSLGPLGRMELDVVLKNTSRWPLALGPGMPIHSRILLVPSLQLEGRDIRLRPDGTINQQAVEFLQPEVIELDQKIRLKPGESVSMRIWAARGGVGRLLERAPTQGATIRWRGYQGFVPKQEGGFDVGPHSVTVASGVIHRVAAAGVADESAALARIGGASIEALPEALLVVREWLTVQLGRGGLEIDAQNALIANLAGAILARYDELPAALKSLVISYYSTYGFFVNQETRPLTERLLEETDPLVRLAMLSSYGPHVPDSYLEELMAGEDALIAEVAGQLYAQTRGDQPEEEQAPLEPVEVLPGLEDLLEDTGEDEG